MLFPLEKVTANTGNFMADAAGIKVSLAAAIAMFLELFHISKVSPIHLIIKSSTFVLDCFLVPKLIEVEERAGG